MKKLLLAILLLPAGAWAIPAIVGTPVECYTNINSNCTTGPYSTTTGATLSIIAVGGFQGGATPPDPTDSQGNSYTALTLYLGVSTSSTVKLYYKCGPSVANNMTASLATTGPNNAYFVKLVLFSGTATSLCYENSTDSGSVDGSGHTGSVTALATNDLILTMATDASCTNPGLSAPGGFTIIADQNIPGNPDWSELAWGLAADTSAHNYTWTNSGCGAPWAINVAIFSQTPAAPRAPAGRALIF